jgi:hypothetical protein
MSYERNTVMILAFSIVVWFISGLAGVHILGNLFEGKDHLQAYDVWFALFGPLAIISALSVALIKTTIIWKD